MKTLFDTSVLVAAFQDLHPEHARALSWFEKGQSGAFEWVVAAHSLAEVYAVLTGIPGPLRAPPVEARELLERNLPLSHVVHLTASDYRSVVSRMAGLALTGGSIYDALIAKVAEKAGVKRLLTFNADDFLRVWPEGKDRIASP